VAAKLFDDLPADRQARPDVLSNRAVVHGSLADALGLSGQLAQAADAYPQALALQRCLVEAAPGDPDPLLRLAARHSNYAFVLRNLRRPEQSEKAGDEGLALARRLVRLGPGLATSWGELGAALHERGVLLYERKDYRAAAERAREAAEQQQRALALAPTDAKARQRLSGHYQLLAASLARLGEREEAARAAAAAAALRGPPKTTVPPMTRADD
jgi:tetratricopeptide (TPR) repeat protein